MLFALVFALCFQFILGSYPFHCGLILCDPPLCPNPINKPEFCCPVCPDRTPSSPPPTLPTGPPTLPPPPVVPPGGGCAAARCDVPCPNPIPPREGECCPRCLEDCRVISCALPICDVPTITPLGRCCPLCPSTPTPTTSPPTTGPSCPPDVPLVFCANAPTACEEEICPNFRNARCVFDNCGGCNTKFFVGQREVTDRCGRVGDRPPSATCPPNVPIVRCANAPTACEEATCPNFPNAQCIFDNCGGCDAKFFVGNRDVTKRCERAAPVVSPPSPPTTPSPPSCPPDVPLVFCANAATACEEATCPNFPNARCVFDNCGDCHTKFFIGNRDVTDRCGATTPPTTPSPPITGPSSCPPDVPLVFCINAPTACEEEICPNFRNARCVFDNCGGCNTKFFVGQREVTDRCGRVGDRPPSATCPPNVPIVRCANAPTACEEATCPNFPNAQCIFDNCGGCDAKFFVGNRDVTKRCERAAPAVSPPSPPTTPSPPSCPPDVPLVFCANAATACEEATCPNFPNARCVFDNCGDCHTKFFIGNRDVTDRCDTAGPVTRPPPPPPPPHSCPPDVPLVNCLIDPCQTARCPNFPNARCVFDSCGGCNAKFFVGQREVTNRCNNHRSCPVDGQVFQECRSCPATCSRPDIACAAVCIPGCGCPDGKLIDERNNICVDREKCSIEGGGTAVGHSCPIAGQVFQRCRSCPATCSNPNRICTLECRPGCGCPAGHVIDEANKRCVPLDKCPTSSDVCNLRPERGPCRAFIRRYYHNSLTGRCQSFIYGGCQGNENNFRSIQDCHRKCRGQGETSSSATCLLPRVTGPCRAAFRRYFYNSATKRCEPFVYGGCAGNQNNFRTLSECQSECKKETPALCQLPREPGPCRASIPRWHYNSQRRQCERFIYGGCLGNDNNFSTKSECESVCHRGDPPNRPPVCTEVFCTGNPNHICTLPSDTPNTVPGRSHCDVTVCRACYNSLYPLPHPPLHRRCPQVIPLFRRNSSKCSSPDLIRQWGYCIQRAHKRAYRYLYGNLYNGGSFRCYRPPYPFYG